LEGDREEAAFHYAKKTEKWRKNGGKDEKIEEGRRKTKGNGRKMKEGRIIGAEEAIVHN
jgi:hypothetical protein